MTQNWRIPTDFTTWMKQIEKRLMHEERRPLIGQASDLLGPGAAPYAVQIWDWNGDEAAFTGVFYSNPDDGQANAPGALNDVAWIGETFGTPDGWGFQRLTEVYPNKVAADADGWPSITPRRRERHFYTPGGTRIYSDWLTL